MKILVVHRQKSTVAAIQSVLRKGQTVARYTESGLDGLLTSRIEHFDMIICGTDLPVVTGFELVRSLRTNSVNRQTPVVFVSDTVSDKVQQLATALDAKGIILEKQIAEELPAFLLSAENQTPLRATA